MRLKQITLINFKSYRGETKVFIEDGATMIVGRNGAGKSNFLHAIDFIVGSRHAHLSRLSRPRLINTSDNRASVEVVLHDDDGLFGGELVIKREFDLQLDKFYLNGSRLQQSELIILLEVLGFSRPTAYHANSSIQLKELVLSSKIERLNALINYLGLSVALTVSFIRKLLPNLEEWGTKLTLFEEQVKVQNPDEIRAEMARHHRYSTLRKMKSALRFRISCLRKESWKNLMEVELNTASLKGENAQALHSLKSAIGSCKIALEKAESDALSAEMLLDGYMQSKELLTKTLESLNFSINENEYQLEIEEHNISVEDVVEVARSTIPERVEELENSVSIEKAAVNELCKKLSEEEQNRDDLLLKLNCNEKFSTLPEKKRWIESTVSTWIMSRKPLSMPSRS
uniref:Chromosome segregation protein sudA n=1 Tax=Lygus hesperus TaxID=30085 RepID=A0A0A9XWK3_LYGHE